MNRIKEYIEDRFSDYAYWRDHLSRRKKTFIHCVLAFLCFIAGMWTGNKFPY